MTTESRKAAKKRYYAKHGDRVRAYAKTYNESHRLERREYARAWEVANKEHRDAYRLLNKDRIKENQRRTKAKNMHRILAANRVYSQRARKPTSWADKPMMRDLYLLAKIYRDAGFPCHVDHIVPLCGKLVSGLHTHENLRVMPAGDNIRKRNHWVIE